MEFKKMLILLFVINNFNNNIKIVYFSSKAAIYTLAHFYPSIPILYYIPIHVGRYFSFLMVTQIVLILTSQGKRQYRKKDLFSYVISNTKIKNICTRYINNSKVSLFLTYVFCLNRVVLYVLFFCRRNLNVTLSLNITSSDLKNKWSYQ